MISPQCSTRLDARLKSVANLLSGRIIADIGTDHARLPRYLLENRLATKVIAVEKHLNPAELARRSLKGYHAEVRIGDGFSVLAPYEVNSAAICGMGGTSILKILTSSPCKLPKRLVLQANRDTPKLRMWAHHNRYHLIDEVMVKGHSNFVILSLEQHQHLDPIYDDLCLNLAYRFGPHLLEARHPLLFHDILARQAMLRGTPATQELDLLDQALEYWQH